MSRILPLCLISTGLLACFSGFAQESLPPLKDGQPPQNLEELWGPYDPTVEPLEVEITKEWENNGIVCRVIRYRVGTFKGEASRVAAFFAFPKNAQKLPGLMHLHGGGQSASLDTVMTDAKRGYASISLNWGGNKMSLGKDGVYEGPQTDWGKLDATHPPQRNKTNHFAGGLKPDEFTLDPVESPRNSNWLLVVIAARRALTFLEKQPEVDASRLGVYGHSMGGRLTTQVTGIDKRVKAAVPSCGGSGVVLESQTDLPGGSKSKTPPMDLACVAENSYITKIAVPVLWLSPTNDFHAHIDNMAYTWRDVPDALLRLSMAPHFNHRHTPEHAITQHLWFEEHLKGAFKMPRTPQLVINLKGSKGIPEIVVTPDSDRPVKKVDIYYSTDPHGLTRFWRDAGAVNDGNRWKAEAPVMSLDEPIFAYANVVYDTPAEYRKIPQNPGGGDTDVFALSSREVYAMADQLKAAGVKATDKPDRLLDDGTRGWHDWYRLNWGNDFLWHVFTRKAKDAKWRGPNGAKLVFEVNPQVDSSLVVNVQSNEWGAFPGVASGEYYALKTLKGSGDFQTVSVGIEELMPVDSKTKAPLQNWQTLTSLSFCPSMSVTKDGVKTVVGGGAWKNSKQTVIRNLRWEGGEYAAGQRKGGALSEEELRKNFNEAIKQSLEQEKLDRK